MARPRHPLPLVAHLDRASFGSLRDGAKDTLIDRFLRWTFQHPDQRGQARALQVGEWLPMQPVYAQGEQPLGEGGMGVVHLWCCIDGNNRILDRVIVKQVHPGVYTWEKKGMWRNGVLGSEPRESMLGNQIHANLEALAAGHGKFVTECLGYGNMQDPDLSDFGSSRVIDFMVQHRFAPPESIQRAFYPPELAQVGHLQYEVDNMQISRKTNIWQIGMLITCMMRIEFYLPECEWRHGQSIIHPDDELHFHDPNRREIQPGRFQHANCNYSAELLALARQCMRFIPDHRPEPRALLRQIQARIPGSCGGMDTYTGNANGKIPWNKKERLRNVKKNNEWPLNEVADVVDVF